ncbi:Aldo-keto reductase family 1 member A1-A [Frankliniella fusca]|uniref:Aldo-keto reductase family 1 member A1-A n=1 Tax=Frankliniella fusca TaxID=407009 RepID=A0AAE1H0G9_9NEOP|nr:Aldo-keto reductase family 1 member A1-A [Frankliniella fusca]
MPALRPAPTVALNDGTRIPVIGLGTYMGNPLGRRLESDVGQVEQAVLDAIDIGYRHVDGALLYQNEEEVGRAVRAKIAQGVIKREDMFICTKLWNNSHHPDAVESTCRKSLSNLGLDYVDLYLMHWPVAFRDGDDLKPLGPDGKVLFSHVDILDTWRAMEQLVRKGLTRSIGVSNFNERQLRRLMDHCSIRPVVNQVECHPYLSQAPLLALCQQLGVRVVAYSPFGSPESDWSLGKVDRLLDDPTIAEVGRRHGKTPGQVILRSLVQRGAIPIPKSVTKSRIRENFDIFDFELSAQDMATLEALNKNRRMCPFLEGLGHPEYPF